MNRFAASLQYTLKLQADTFLSYFFSKGLSVQRLRGEKRKEKREGKKVGRSEPADKSRLGMNKTNKLKVTSTQKSTGAFITMLVDQADVNDEGHLCAKKGTNFVLCKGRCLRGPC